MNRFSIASCGFALAFSLQTAVACDYPQRIQVPNGASATKEEMLSAQKTVKTYVADMEAYLDCILEEEKAARAAIEDLTPEVEQQREDMLTNKYNAAVDEMETVAARFNTEVQAYKSRDN
jgi:hypothetical protein